MCLILNYIVWVSPFSVWCVIPLVIVAFLLFYVVKLHRVSKELKRVDQINNIIWSNVQEYLFLIDRDFKICRTNFYEINQIAQNRQKKRFGEIIGCEYACKTGVCGTHPACLLCLVRKQLRETFASRDKFSNYELVMNLCTPDKTGTDLYNVMASGTYLSLDNEDYILLTIHDISREKALEKTVKRSNEKFLSVFDNLPVGCAIFDKEGVVKEVNDTYMEYIGVNSKGDAIDKLNIFDNPCVDAEYKEKMRAGTPVAGEVKYDYEQINATYVRTGNKPVRYFRFIVNYLKDARGNIEFYVVIWVDNTLIHNTLKRNKAFEDMTALASRVSNIGFGSVNLVNNEQITTPGYLKNLGLEPTDRSSVFSQFRKVHDSQRNELIGYLKKAVKEKTEPFEMDIRIEINGQYHWIRQIIMQQAFEPENGNIVLLGVNIDITDRKENERELKAAKDKAESSDNLKSAFIANMSHEIRTPLNAIIGFSDLLATTDSQQEKDSYREIINRNNELLLQLISDILDLSKIEADTLEFNWSAVDINNLFKEIEYSSRLKNKENKEVRISFVPGLPHCVIHTERTRISQVITNFMTNAMKFTESGGIVFGYEQQPTGIRFYVRDTGCGISEDKLPDVFNRFVKLNNFRQGTGLGLAICQSIVNKLKGEIGVNSVPGQGSEFWFRLPCQPLERSALPQPLMSEKISCCSLGKSSGSENKRFTILVAEDIEDNYRLCEILLKSKYNLLHAWDGQEAVELYLKHAPDVVLMDIRMPNWDGYEATQAIRHVSAEVPIIALTAFAFNEDRERILASGFDACLTKPVKSQELYSTLSSFNL